MEVDSAQGRIGYQALSPDGRPLVDPHVLLTAHRAHAAYVGVLAAVSYTHLDVYKRQIQGWVTGASPAFLLLIGWWVKVSSTVLAVILAAIALAYVALRSLIPPTQAEPVLITETGAAHA